MVTQKAAKTKQVSSRRVSPGHCAITCNCAKDFFRFVG